MATKAADNRFGRVKFNQTKFGASVSRDALAWGIDVDWDGDGLFSGASEDQYLLGITRSRGRQAWLQPKGGGFENIATGQCILTLDNSTGRYDGWNTASPLYPNVSGGKDVRIRVRDLSTGIIYPYFYGVLDDIQPVGYGTNAQVKLYVYDGWRYLRDNPGRVALSQNVSVDSAIGAILDACGWPSRWGRNMDVESSTIPYFWSTGSRNAGDVIDEIAKAYLDFFFVGADGKARFIKRQSAAASGISLSQDQILKDIGNPQPFMYQRNITRIRTHQYSESAVGTVIYQLGGTAPSIISGGSMTIWAQYTYNGASVSAKNVITPVASTDYTMNSQPDGSGTNKTSACSVSITDFGDTCKIVITNSDPGVVYITLLQLRGTAVYAQSISEITYPSDTSTVVQPQEFVHDFNWLQDINVAVDFTNVMGPFMASLHPTPMIQIESRPDLQFALDLFDIVPLTIDKLGIGGLSFRVGGIEDQSLDEGCQSILTKFYLEPYISADSFWIWDTAVFDSTTVFGW